MKREKKIVQEYLGTSSTEENVVKGRIVDLASCTMIHGDVHLAIITDSVDSTGVCVYVNPHEKNLEDDTVTFRLVSSFDFKFRGKPRCVGLSPGVLAVGTNSGLVVVSGYDYKATVIVSYKSKMSVLMEIPLSYKSKMSVLMEIPPPQGNNRSYFVTSVQLSMGVTESVNIENRLYVAYKRKLEQVIKEDPMRPMGVCCYDLGNLSKHSASFSTRFALDGRDIDNDIDNGGICALDAGTGNLVVGRNDGLYIYAAKYRSGVAPIDGGGNPHVMCSLQF